MITLVLVVAIGWTAPECISADTLDDELPAITADGSGNVWVSWSSLAGLFARRWDGDDWSEVMVVDSGGESYPYGSPDMDRGPGGEPWVVWNGKALLETAVYGGGGWRLVPTAFNPGWRPQIVGNPLCMTWMEFSSGGAVCASFYYWGGGWGPPDTVTYIGLCLCLKWHAMTADSVGNVWAIWKPHEDVLYAKSSRDEWEEQMTVVREGVSWSHTATADGSGRIWVGYVGGIALGGSGVCASYYDGLDWSEPALVCSTTANPDRLNSQTDRSGTVWLCWDGGRASRDVFASCYESSEWVTSAVDTCSSNDWYPSMTCDGEGNVWVAWSSDRDGDYNIYVSRTLAIGGTEESESACHELRLEVFPDPFRSATSIGYIIPESGDVRIVLYNLLGEHVRTLLDEYQSVGRHTIVWDGTDSSGRKVPGGPYFLRLTIASRGQTATKKLTLVR